MRLIKINKIGKGKGKGKEKQKGEREREKMGEIIIHISSFIQARQYL